MNQILCWCATNFSIQFIVHKLAFILVWLLPQVVDSFISKRLSSWSRLLYGNDNFSAPKNAMGAKNTSGGSHGDQLKI